MMFRDRVDGGRRLAEELERRHLDNEDVVVAELPEAGYPLRPRIAHALARPLDVILVRKLGVPFQPGWPWSYRPGRSAHPRP